MIVRSATANDCARIVELFGDMHKSTGLGWIGGFDASYIQCLVLDWLGSADHCVIVAESCGVVVGFLMACIVTQWWNPSAKHAQEMTYWVDPKCRGNHAGRMLFDEFDQWSESKNMRYSGFYQSGKSDSPDQLKKFRQSLGFLNDSIVSIKER